MPFLFFAPGRNSPTRMRTNTVSRRRLTACLLYLRLTLLHSLCISKNKPICRYTRRQPQKASRRRKQKVMEGNINILKRYVCPQHCGIRVMNESPRFARLRNETMPVPTHTHIYSSNIDHPQYSAGMVVLKSKYRTLLFLYVFSGVLLSRRIYRTLLRPFLLAVGNLFGFLCCWGDSAPTFSENRTTNAFWPIRVLRDVLVEHDSFPCYNRVQLSEC